MKFFQIKNSSGKIAGYAQGENREDAFYNFRNGDLLVYEEPYHFEEIEEEDIPYKIVPGTWIELEYSDLRTVRENEI